MLTKANKRCLAAKLGKLRKYYDAHGEPAVKGAGKQVRVFARSVAKATGDTIKNVSHLLEAILDADGEKGRFIGLANGQAYGGAEEYSDSPATQEAREGMSDEALEFSGDWICYADMAVWLTRKGGRSADALTDAQADAFLPGLAAV